jgi:RimJ/RimL family protein N-acetyltransferase
VSDRVELLTLDGDEWRMLGDEPAAFADRRELLLGDQAGILRELGAGTAAFLARLGGEARWGSFLAVDPAGRLVIGTCSYKGPPDADGAVEIAYFTFPPYEGRGYASSMAALLIARAGAPPPARSVRAHTLPERNASVRILEKLGFAHLGQVVDPEDGPVWRWERAPGLPPV